MVGSTTLEQLSSVLSALKRSGFSSFTLQRKTAPWSTAQGISKAVGSTTLFTNFPPSSQLSKYPDLKFYA